VAYPPPLLYATAAEYELHFEAHYCRVTIHTFDGIRVFFPRSAFQHAFFHSKRGRVAVKTSVFARERAKRMDWIAAALQDPSSDRFVGWDSKTKAYDFSRRVTLVQGDYVVVIAITGPGKASFITAFVADSATTLAAIRSSPRWK
jgi:hypothetical protein